MNGRSTAEPHDPLEGTDPIDFDAITFAEALRVTEALAIDEADRWGAWFLTSGLVDAPRIEAGGVDALDEIWSGVLAAEERGWFSSATWDELVAAGPVPLWCRLRPGYEEFLGVTGCWVAAGAVALTSRWIEREWGGSWVLPPDRRGMERADPGIAIPGDRGFVPQVQVVGSVGGVAGLRGAPERNPDRLRELVLMNAPEDGDDGGSDTDPIGPAVSPATGDGRWLIGFSDLQGHDESDRIDRFVDSIAAAPDVGRAYREDRELVVVESTLRPERLQALADAAWAVADT